MNNSNDSNLQLLGFKIASRANAMLAYWDKNLVCRFANSAYKDWFGISPDDMINKIRLNQLLGEELFAKNFQFIESALMGNEQTFERIIKTSSGLFRKSIATYSPDFEHGKVKGFCVHVADISPSGICSRESDQMQVYHSPAKKIYLPEDTIDQLERFLRSAVYREFPGIPFIARKYFLTESTLKREFKKRFQQTIYAYFRNLQMEKAHEYICEKGYGIKQAAALFGFANRYNFTVCYNRFLSRQCVKKIINESVLGIEGKYKKLFINAPFALAVFDSQLKLVAISEKWTKDFNFESGELDSLTLRELIPDFERIGHFEAEATMVKESFSEKKWLLNNYRGLGISVKFDIRPWKGENNSVAGYYVMAEKIYDRGSHN